MLLVHLQVQQLGLPELQACAPPTILSLRQAVVNAFASLLSQDIQDAQSSDTRREADPGVMRALHFVGRQVLRAPPPALPHHFAIACIALLSRQKTERSPEEQNLLTAFVQALDASGGESAAQQGDGSARLSDLIASLLQQRSFEAASALYMKVGNVAAALDAGLQNCQAVAQLLSKCSKLTTHLQRGEASPDDAKQLEELQREAAQLVGAAAACAAESQSSTGQRAAQAHQLQDHVWNQLQRMLSSWLHSCEPYIAGQEHARHSEAARDTFAKHFAFLLELEQRVHVESDAANRSVRLHAGPRCFARVCCS